MNVCQYDFSGFLVRALLSGEVPMELQKMDMLLQQIAESHLLNLGPDFQKILGQT